MILTIHSYDILMSVSSAAHEDNIPWAILRIHLSDSCDFEPDVGQITPGVFDT